MAFYELQISSKFPIHHQLRDVKWKVNSLPYSRVREQLNACDIIIVCFPL